MELSTRLTLFGCVSLCVMETQRRTQGEEEVYDDGTLSRTICGSCDEERRRKRRRTFVDVDSAASLMYELGGRILKFRNILPRLILGRKRRRWSILFFFIACCCRHSERRRKNSNKRGWQRVSLCVEHVVVCYLVRVGEDEEEEWNIWSTAKGRHTNITEGSDTHPTLQFARTKAAEGG